MATKLNTRVINLRTDKTWDQIKNTEAQLYKGEILLVPVEGSGYAMRIAMTDAQGKLSETTKYLVNPDIESEITTINQTLQELTGSEELGSVEDRVKTLLGGMLNEQDGVVVNFAVDDDGKLTGLEKRALSSSDISDWTEKLTAKLDESVFNDFLAEDFKAVSDKLTNVSNVLNFKGAVENNPVTITSGYNNGDVVIYGNKEYVYSGTSTSGTFIEFGDTSVVSQELNNYKNEVNNKFDSLENNNYEVIYTAHKASGIADGAVGFTTADQVYDMKSGLEQSISDISSNYIKINNSSLTDQQNNTIVLDAGLLFD